MNYLTYSSSPDTKLCTKLFADLRLQDKQKLAIGSQVCIMYRNQPLGVAKIISTVDFYFENINESICQLSFNKPAASVKIMLSRFYANVGPKTIFTFLVLEWVTREIEYQESLLKPFWETQRESNTHAKPAQTALF